MNDPKIGEFWLVEVTSYTYKEKSVQARVEVVDMTEKTVRFERLRFKFHNTGLFLKTEVKFIEQIEPIEFPKYGEVWTVQIRGFVGLSEVLIFIMDDDGMLIDFRNGSMPARYAYEDIKLIEKSKVKEK